MFARVHSSSPNQGKYQAGLMPMWGQSIAPTHGWRESCLGATRLPRANALQDGGCWACWACWFSFILLILHFLFFHILDQLDQLDRFDESFHSSHSSHSFHSVRVSVRVYQLLQELLEIFPEDRQSMLKVAGEHGNWREVLALHLQSVDDMPAEERGRNWSLCFFCSMFLCNITIFVSKHTDFYTCWIYCD